MKNYLYLLTVIMLFTACGNKQKKDPGASDVDITGAGATFPLPYYNIVFKDYMSKTGSKITYGGIGSGGGIRSLMDKTVDFGASDAFLSDEELNAAPAEVLHIPTCMGAVVLAYNLPDIKGLNLTGNLISAIYLGKITRWNDPAIQALNPDVALPDKPVVPVYRSDGSGTTFVFSDYMTKVDPEWAEKIGSGKSLKWPAGIAAKGNPGVAGIIQQTEGAIGYVGSEYGFALSIPVARLQNAAGRLVEPNTASIAAAANIELPADMRAVVTNSSDPDAYPISCFTWVLVYKNQAYGNRTEAQFKALVSLLDYMLSTDAQGIAEKVHYSPLPATALQNAKNLVSSIKFE